MGVNYYTMENNKYNKEGYEEGYWEIYYRNRKIFAKGNYINGDAHGYWEYYNSNSVLNLKEYFII